MKKRWTWMILVIAVMLVLSCGGMTILSLVILGSSGGVFGPAGRGDEGLVAASWGMPLPFALSTLARTSR